MRLTTERKILLGRLLTRSGDQAWDFAVPLILLTLLPGQLKIAALYYLLVRLALVLVLPRFASLIDRMDRVQVVRIGLLSQVIGVILSAGAIFTLEQNFNLPFAILILAGIVGGLGTSFMDIAVANDLVPTTVRQENLAAFNSRLRQVDLGTEVTAPILAGLLLLLKTPTFPLLGFSLVIFWNVISFFPEYFLLTSIFRDHPEIAAKVVSPQPAIKTSLIEKLTAGWHSFFKEPVALAVIAYALLWLSVLSPHGVLLAAFLKDDWKTPEWIIGSFRGLGAVFGLMATFLFPYVERKFGVVKASLHFLFFQSAMVALALYCFHGAGHGSQISFMAFILLSRIGLYGFSIGEMQIRQVRVPEAVRGRVNGFANALTGLATLLLFGAGALLPESKDFLYLVTMSVSSVILAAVIFYFWSKKYDC